MLLTLVTIYLLLYMVLIILIQFSVYSKIPYDVKSTRNFWFIVLNCSGLNYPVIFCCLFLSGVPPFFMFFVKFNILINLLNKVGVVMLFFICLILVFSTLFYLQIFHFYRIQYLTFAFQTSKRLKFRPVSTKFIYSCTFGLIFINIFSLYFFTWVENITFLV